MNFSLVCCALFETNAWLSVLQVSSYTFQISVNAFPEDLVRMTLEKRAKTMGESVPDASEFVLKVCGFQEYLLGHFPLAQFMVRNFHFEVGWFTNVHVLPFHGLCYFDVLLYCFPRVVHGLVISFNVKGYIIGEIILDICDHTWENAAKVASTQTRQIEWKGHECVNRSKMFLHNINNMSSNYQIPELQVKQKNKNILIWIFCTLLLYSSDNKGNF